jgi:hypothetical protein
MPFGARTAETTDGRARFDDGHAADSDPTAVSTANYGSVSTAPPAEVAEQPHEQVPDGENQGHRQNTFNHSGCCMYLNAYQKA